MEPNKKVTHENEKASTAEKVTGVTTEIYFEGGPPMSREMRTSVARLQLGPPAKARDHPHLGCCWQAGLPNNGTLDALRCGSCLRMSKSVKPTPSSTASTVKYLGAVGDHLQSGIIFIRLLTGETVPVLGIVCASTNDHAAKVIKSRHADDVLASIIEIWYKPLGLPISIAVDADSLLEQQPGMASTYYGHRVRHHPHRGSMATGQDRQRKCLDEDVSREID